MLPRVHRATRCGATTSSARVSPVRARLVAEPRRGVAFGERTRPHLPACAHRRASSTPRCAPWSASLLTGTMCRPMMTCATSLPACVRSTRFDAAWRLARSTNRQSDVEVVGRELEQRSVLVPRTDDGPPPGLRMHRVALGVEHRAYARYAPRAFAVVTVQRASSVQDGPQSSSALFSRIAASASEPFVAVTLRATLSGYQCPSSTTRAHANVSPPDTRSLRARTPRSSQGLSFGVPCRRG